MPRGLSEPPFLTPKGGLERKRVKWRLHPLIHTYYSKGMNTTSWEKARGGVSVRL